MSLLTWKFFCGETADPGASAKSSLLFLPLPPPPPPPDSYERLARHSPLIVRFGVKFTRFAAAVAESVAPPSTRFGS